MIHKLCILIVAIIHSLLLFGYPENKKANSQLFVNTHSPSIKVSLRKTLETARPKGSKSSSKFANKNKSQSISAETVKIQGIINGYLQELTKKIQSNLIYPRLSKRLNEKGKVTVRFIIEKDGSLTSIEVIQQSSYKRLDRAAVSTLQELDRHLPIPNSFKKNRLQVLQVIDFS